MAAITVSALRDKIIAIGGDVVEDITEDNVLAFLPIALVSRSDELLRLSPAARKTETTLTFTSEGNTIALPTDTDFIKQVVVYSGGSTNGLSLSDDFVRVRDGVLWFAITQPSGTEYTIRYTKHTNTYALATDTVTETETPRGLHILAWEIMSLYIQNQEDLEADPASQNVLVNSNRISR